MVEELVPSGCGVAAELGEEEPPLKIWSGKKNPLATMRFTDGIELVASGGGTEVSVVETAAQKNQRGVVERSEQWTDQVARQIQNLRVIR